MSEYDLLQLQRLHLSLVWQEMQVPNEGPEGKARGTKRWGPPLVLLVVH